MSVKSLLVFADDSDASAARLETAIAMAGRHHAHLAALALIEQPAYYYGVGSEVAADVYLADVERAKQLAKSVADGAGKVLADADRGGDTRWGTGTLDALGAVAARHARYADLTLVGQPFEGDQEALLTRVFEGVLFESGRPVVVVPRHWTDGAFGARIMIAWAPRKEAARAVADAMPLLLEAESVHVAIVDPEPGEAAHGEEPGADLAALLARHGIRVTVDPLPSGGQGVAARLVTHAADCGASLVVMGGYGHWRLRQSLFGGVTRSMVRESPVPLLLSH